MNDLKAITTVVLIAFLCSAKIGAMPAVDAPIVFIGIDGSDSYNIFEQSKLKVRELIQALPAGTRCTIRLITADSYLDANIVLTKDLPRVGKGNDNPFDTRSKRIVALGSLRLNKEKNAIIDEIVKIAHPRSQFTDIYGFLAVVNEKMTHESVPGRPVYCVLFSDGLNNVEKYHRCLGMNALKGVRIRFAAFKSTAPEVKAQWLASFKTMGTADILFFGMDEDLSSIFKASEPVEGEKLP